MTAILVTGGTGTLGRPLVERLLDAGHDVRIASRRPAPDGPLPYAWRTVDYRTGEGLDDALRGVDAVVHCAASLGLDVDRTLIAHARRAGVPHLVYISIVGIERVPLFYYRNKLAAERLLIDSGVPWTILRATQFHDLVVRVLAALARLPVLAVPTGTSFQPVDTGEVAARLAELAVLPPSGRVTDMGGPQVRRADDLARAYLHATGTRRAVFPLHLPGAVARGYRQGGHLAPEHAVGTIGFEEFLARRVTAQRRDGAAGVR